MIHPCNKSRATPLPTTLTLTMSGSLIKAALSKQAGELGTNIKKMLHLRWSHWLASSPGTEATQVDSLTETLGEITCRKHRFDQLKHLELDPLRLFEVASLPVAVEFHHCFGCNSAGSNRATITTHE